MTVATFDDVIRKAVPEERFVNCGGVTEAVLYGNESYVRNPDNEFLYMPVSSLEEAVREHSFFSNDFLDEIRALENAHFYTIAIIDEDLPSDYGDVTLSVLGENDLFCRQHMIVCLGEIRYDPACPNLREAMLHDLNYEIRGSSAKALGKIGDKSYTQDLIEVVRKYEEGRGMESFVAWRALAALGTMKDESVLPVLREMLHEGKEDFYLACFTRDRELGRKAEEKIKNVAGALYKIGGNAIPILLEVFEDMSEHDWIKWLIGKGVEYSQLD